MRSKKTWARCLVAGLMAAGVSHALSDGKTSSADAQATVKSEARGVEMSQTSSVVQRGVKRGSLVSLEKTLDLIARPRPGGGGGSKSAAGIGGGGGRPAGGGGGDGNARSRMKGLVREMMNTGS